MIRGQMPTMRCKTYPLLFGRTLDYFVHHHGKDFCHLANTGPIRARSDLSIREVFARLTCLLYPLSCNRVYYIEDTKFMRRCGLFELRIDLLNDGGLGLFRSKKYKSATVMLLLALH